MERATRWTLLTASLLTALGGLLAVVLVTRGLLRHVEMHIQGVRPEDLAAPPSPARWAALRAFLQERLPPSVLRLRLRAPDGTVVYSDLAEEVGRRDPLGGAALEALRSGPVWRLERPGTGEEGDRPGQVLKVYVPLRGPQEPRPWGVMEVDLSPEPYRGHLEAVRRSLLAAALLAVLALPGLFYPLYRASVRSLEQEHRRVREAEARERALREQLQASLEGTIQALTLLLDRREAYTAGHCRRVATLALACAAEMGLPPEERERARLGGLLHDIGKLGIRVESLEKPGPLTEEEWQEIRRHPTVGEAILRQIPALEAVAPVVRHHHERWDGRGYPDGLRGEAIPLLARIVAVCDAYEAMVSDRPYRKGLPPEQALEELRRGAGTQFDPQVVSAFLRAVERPMPAGPVPSPSPLAGLTSTALARALLQRSPVGMALLSTDLHLVLANPALESLLRVPAGTVTGRPCWHLRLPCSETGPCRGGRGPCPAREVLATGEPYPLLHRLEGRSLVLRFAPLPDEDGRPIGLAVTVEDVTERLTDPLTGLYNYRFLQEALEGEVARCRRSGDRVALVLLDLDRFQRVNERWGHPYGDRVLRRAAELITRAVRAGDLVFRTGGDEFAVLAPRAGQREAQALGAHLARQVEEAFRREGLSASWGWAAFPDDGPDLGPRDLYRLADRRLSGGKGSGATPRPAPPPEGG